MTPIRVLAHGEPVPAGDSLSVGSLRDTRELRNVVLEIRDPRRRLLVAPGASFNLPLAIARFVWMMSGSDRVQDIAFYGPSVERFSDDGLALAGSDFGHRIRRARPGVDQLRFILHELAANPTTRRATATVSAPEDAGRRSRDVPCAIALSYANRRGVLHSTTLMRSSEALRILPYDVFDFSMLAEVLASELAIPLGALTHFAVSFHVYDEDAADAERMLDAAKDSDRDQIGDLAMDVMPVSPSPLEQVAALARLEWTLRTDGVGFPGGMSIADFLASAQTRLAPYWYHLLLVLIWYTVKKRTGSDQAGEDIKAEISSIYRCLLPST